MTAYYNEHDPIAAEWLRRLIAAGHVAPGEVDERDIRDVAPAELVRFTQCHFFAGVGIWSLALRSAGWPDDRPIWSGSCPCQPFSAAGAGEGFADERHLWPHWHWLIQNCRPPVVVGEQVASKDGLGWLDLVSDDLGGIAYAVGAVDLCAAGFGVDWRGGSESQRLERAVRLCPDPLVARHLAAFADWADTSLGVGGFHIRQRLYVVALADDDDEGRGLVGAPHDGRGGDEPRDDADGRGPAGELVDDAGRGRGERGAAPLAGPGGHADGAGAGAGGVADRDSADAELASGQGPGPGEAEGRRARGEPAGRRDADGLVDRERAGLEGRGPGPADARVRGRGDAGPDRPASAPGALDRLGDDERERRDGGGDEGRQERPGRGRDAAPGHAEPAGGLDDGLGDGRGARRDRDHGGDERLEPDADGATERLADPDGGESRDGGLQRDDEHGLEPADPGAARRGIGGLGGRDDPELGAGEDYGERGAVDWLFCRDGYWRPVEAGTFPLADAAPGRVGALRAYGNGLDFETASAFCAAVRDIVTERGQ